MYIMKNVHIILPTNLTFRNLLPQTYAHIFPKKDVEEYSVFMQMYILNYFLIER